MSQRERHGVEHAHALALCHPDLTARREAALQDRVELCNQGRPLVLVGAVATAKRVNLLSPRYELRHETASSTRPIKFSQQPAGPSCPAKIGVCCVLKDDLARLEATEQVDQSRDRTVALLPDDPLAPIAP